MKTYFSSIFLIVALSFGFLYPLVTFTEFHLVDPLHFEKTTEMHAMTSQNFEKLWNVPRNDAYTPFTYTLWFLQAQLAQRVAKPKAVYGPTRPLESLNPRVFRIFNLLTHTLCSVLVFFLLFKLFEHYTAALVGALLFALHPLHVEPIGWITGFRDLLSGLMSLLSILFFCHHCTVGSGDKRKRFYLLSSLFFALAVLSKPAAYATPLLILVLACGWYGRSFKVVCKELLPWGASIPIFLLQSQENNVVVSYAVENYAVWQKPLVALDTIWWNLKKCFFPFHLSLDYGRTPNTFLRSSDVYFTPVVTLLLGVLLYKFRRQNWGKTIFIAFLIFVVGLFPALGLARFIFQHISTVSDRYAYLSIIGLSIIVARFVKENRNPLLIRFSVLAILVFCGFKSLGQTFIWRSKYSLYSHMIKINNASWLGNNNFGSALEEHGKLNRALVHYIKAREHASFAAIDNNIGAAFLKLKDFKSAIAMFERLVTRYPGAIDAYHNLAVAWMRQGNPNMAQYYFHKVFQLDPKYPVSLADYSKFKAILALKARQEKEKKPTG